MKSIYLYLLIILGLGLSSCDEEDFGENYDINLPVSSISDFTPKTILVGEEVKMVGENLDLVKSVYLGAVECEIKSQEADAMVVVVNRASERNQFMISNLYKRTFTTPQFFIPLYYDAKVAQWPSEIQRGKAFTLKGENIDMLKTVKVGSTTLTRQGKAAKSKAVYSVKDVALEETAVITAEDRNGNKFVSEAIPVVAPKDTYIPATTILLADFDEVIPEYVNDNLHAHTAGIDKSGVVPAFMHYWSTLSDKGNGWDGNYHRLICRNALGGAIDFSGFTAPHITFMVNTNGKAGYMNPLINGKDAHFANNPEYSDDHKFETKGWEWRSYDLKEMGYDLSKAVETIELLVRGGNVDGVPFELNIDRVMITDGALRPLLISDFETNVQMTGNGQIVNGNAGQGQNYFTVSAVNTVAWGPEIATVASPKVSISEYTNALYFNFMLNTTGEVPAAYFQVSFFQNGCEFVKHLAGPNPYGIAHNLDCTNGEWKWRSFHLDLSSFDWASDGAATFDPSADFDVKLVFKPGGVGGDFAVSIDNPMFSATPVDNTVE